MVDRSKGREECEASAKHSSNLEEERYDDDDEEEEGEEGEEEEEEEEREKEEGECVRSRIAGFFFLSSVIGDNEERNSATAANCASCTINSVACSHTDDLDAHVLAFVCISVHASLSKRASGIRRESGSCDDQAVNTPNDANENSSSA